MTEQQIAAQFKAEFEKQYKTKCQVILVFGKLTITMKARTKLKKIAKDCVRCGFTFVNYHENPYAPGTLSAQLVKA
jgi:hypothetical protein